MSVLYNWLIAFGLTQLVEVPILAAWIPGRALTGRVALAFGASALTHPVVWFVIRPAMAPGAWGPYVLAAELFAVLVEAFYLWRLRVRDPLLAAVVANGASWGIGRLLAYLLAAG